MFRYSETLNNEYIERIHQMSYSSLSDNGMLQIFTQLLSYSVTTQLLSYSVTQLLSYSVTQLLSYSVTQLLSYSVTQLLSYSVEGIFPSLNRGPL